MAQYNKLQYNSGQYQYLLLAELLHITETEAKLLSRDLNDALFLDELLTKQITNKGLFDTLRVIDWLSLNRRDSLWSD